MGVLAARREDRGADRRWAAGVVLVAGLLASVAAWRAVRTHEHSEMRRATQLAAQAVRRSLVTDVEWQKAGLDRLAMLWEAADPPRDLWVRNAELYIQHRPGCVAVEWLTPGRERRALVTAGEKAAPDALAFAGRPEALLQRAARAQAATISAPAVLPDGSRQWVIAMPVSAGGEPRGFVLSYFDLERSLDHVLGEMEDLGFSIGVRPPNQAEYVRPGTDRAHERDWATAVEADLTDTVWQVHVWPTTDVVRSIRSMLPEETLGVGALVSLLLAVSLYFGAEVRLSYARARRANETLRDEIGLRETAQAELARAHAELERRIDERTAELAEANTLLRNEVAEHRKAEETLQDLTSRLFQLQDQERRRLARELHDGTVQNLVALSLDVGLIRDAVPADDVGTRDLVRECAGLIDQSTSELRTISYLLHPPYFDELGLAAALRDFVHGFTARSGIQVALDIDPDLGRLGGEVELALYRVVQEALSNVHRHAGSRTARITLARAPEAVRLEVADTGRGMPPEVLTPEGARFAGVGIAGMRERVRGLRGTLEILSGDGGTRIRAVLPTPPPA